MSNDYPVLRGGAGNPNSNEIRQVIALVVGVCVYSPKDTQHNIPKPLSVAENDRAELFHSIDKIQVNKDVQSVLKCYLFVCHSNFSLTLNLPILSIHKTHHQSIR